jgi:hypothetical protein
MRSCDLVLPSFYPLCYSGTLTSSRPFFMAACKAMKRQTFVTQQSTACNLVHTEVQRCARWILMSQDETGRDLFPLRAEYLSVMLALKANKVHAPIGVLEQVGAVRYRDDFITVTSRDELRTHACSCYAAHNIAAFIDAPFASAWNPRFG